MRTRKALVLGDDTRSFLTIVRSLGRQGIEVHAAPLDFGSAALRSRYLARTHYLPLWIGDGAAWLAAMDALLRAERFDLVIPCTEVGLLPLARHRERFAPLAGLAIPHDRAIATLFDKLATRAAAAAAGVPVAPGRALRDGDTAPGIVAEFGLPLLLKPRRSYGLGTLDARGKVQVIRAEAELAAQLARVSPDDYLLEGFFPGRGVGVSVLASGGRVLQAFQHNRIRENHAGGSYYRVSAALDPALARSCAAMAAAADYTGVAMFEFRRNEASGAAVLLEVNARPWGSMPLPVALGVDFPFWWYRLLVDRVEVPRADYRAGIYGRNLMPDLADLVATLQGAGGVAPGLLLRRLAEFGRIFTGRERHDTLVADDPRPGLLEIGRGCGRVFAHFGRRLPGARPLRRLLARRRLRTALGTALGPALGTAPRERAGERLCVLFVCAGNICRSPYAEAALAARHPELAGRVEAASAGTLPRPGRSTPPAGLGAAAARAIDLAPHRSRHLSREAAHAAAVILVFDEANRHAVMARHPELRRRIVMLGDLDGSGAIADPVDGNVAVFAHCYARIDAAVAVLAGLLPGGDAAPGSANRS